MGRRHRHLNHSHLGAMFALDARFLGLAEGASVSTWSDRGGSGRQVTQSGAARPTLLGNFVDFDGSNDEMIGSDSGFPTGDYHACMVTACDISLANNDYEPVMGWGTATTGSAVVFTFATDPAFGTNSVGVSQWGDAQGIASSVGNTVMYESRRSGSSYIHSRNGGAETNRTMTTNTALGGASSLFIGSFGSLLPGFFLNGRIGGVTLFGTVPSASVRRRVAHSQALSFKVAFS
jgi:hypothetical protein